VKITSPGRGSTFSQGLAGISSAASASWPGVHGRRIAEDRAEIWQHNLKHAPSTGVVAAKSR
jgi:hypothetical protein